MTLSQVREPALAMHSDYMSKLHWGGKVVGLRVELPRAQADVVQNLVDTAWESKAPRAEVLARAKSRS